MNVKFFKVLGVITGMSTMVAGEVVQAFSDGALDGSELAGIIKRGITGLRIAGVSQADLDQIQIATTQAEYDALDFQDGDMLIYSPKELTSKLKITV